MDRVPVAVGDDSLLGQHGAVGNGSLDILARQTLVEADRGVDGLHESAWGRGEPPSPHGVGTGFFGFVGHVVSSRIATQQPLPQVAPDAKRDRLLALWARCELFASLKPVDR